MAKKGTTRKDLKEPDEFISFTQRMIDWAISQKYVLIGGTLAVVLVIVGAVGWRWYTRSREQAASRAFVTAMEILNAPVVAPDAEEGTPPEIEGSYPSEKEKLEAALEEFTRVREKHSSVQTASLAVYFMGECNRRLGQQEQAIEHLKTYLNEEGADGDLAVFAMEGIGAALEDMGKDDEAGKYYRRLTEAPFDREPDRGRYHLARLEQKAGNTRQAAQLYNDILQKYPKTPFQQEIQERLDNLPKPEPEDSPGSEDGASDSGPPAEPPAEGTEK